MSWEEVDGAIQYLVGPGEVVVAVIPQEEDEPEMVEVEATFDWNG